MTAVPGFRSPLWGDRTLADDLRDNPREPDKTPHVHFHSHDGSRHAHEHVHPDDHAHSTLSRTERCAG